MVVSSAMPRVRSSRCGRRDRGGTLLRVFRFGDRGLIGSTMVRPVSPHNRSASRYQHGRSQAEAPKFSGEYGSACCPASGSVMIFDAAKANGDVSTRKCHLVERVSDTKPAGSADHILPSAHLSFEIRREILSDFCLKFSNELTEDLSRIGGR
jgi:hypothetical protein